MQIRWEDGFTIKASVNSGEVTIAANREGMRSLANMLLDLAESEPGDHIHLDEHNSLEEVQLVAEDAADRAKGAVTGLVDKIKGN